jgi:hypothetical protein
MQLLLTPPPTSLPNSRSLCHQPHHQTLIRSTTNLTTLARSAVTARLPFFHHPMPLCKFIWNGLYSAQWLKQMEAEVQIQAHYKRMRMGKDKVTVANVWYVSIRLTRPRYRRPAVRRDGTAKAAPQCMAATSPSALKSERCPLQDTPHVSD